MNRDGVLAILTGVGTAKSAAAIMALGMDPRFDLTRAYWLVAGIADSEAMQTARSPYPFANARRPPFVMKGDTLSSGTFWHGKLLNDWAVDWVQYHTGGKGDFVTTAMEDTGTLQSLTFLARSRRADLNRVLVLRTASNFDLPPPGVTAAEHLARTALGKYPAYLPALEAAWRVGNTVVEQLIGNWNKYRDITPAGKH